MIKPHISQKLHRELTENIVGASNIKITYLDEWLTSMRDVTRLANSLILNYKRLEGDVHFPHFLRIELIRLKYPSVYEVISRQTAQFFSTGKDDTLTNFLHDSRDLTSTYHLIKNQKLQTDPTPPKYTYKLEEELSEKKTNIT